MIPTYNCRRFLEQTLGSVVEQASPEQEMEIWVVDDCSPEGSPESLVKEIGGDRVRFHRHEQNLGHVGNFEFCLNKAKGQVIHLLHGDDFVLPGFYEKHESAHREHPEAGAVFCRSRQLDEEGNFLSQSALLSEESGILPSDWIYKLCVTGQLETPSITVKRAVYEKLEAFDPSLGWTEDWEMWGRIAANYPVYFVKDSYACYRKVRVSNTTKRYLTGQNVTDFYRAGRKIQSYLDKVPESVVKEHRKYTAACGIRVALILWPNQIGGVFNNLREAMKLMPWFTLSRFLFNALFKKKRESKDGR